MSKLDRTCDNCGAALEVVASISPMRRRNDYPQFSDALLINLAGGYGMKIDPMLAMLGSSNDWLIFCSKCADELFEQFPSIKRFAHNLEGPDLEKIRLIKT